MRRGIVLSLCVVMLAGTPSSKAWGQAEVQELARRLSEPPERPYGLSVPTGDRRLEAIHRLTEMGTPEAVHALKSFLTTPEGDRKLKQHALVALGKIASREAVEAIRQFESWAEKRRASPPPFTFGLKDHAMDHFAPQEVKPLVTWTPADGREQAVFRWYRFGQWLFYSTTRKDETQWEPPVLLDVPDMGALAGSAKYAARTEGDEIVLGWEGEFRVKPAADGDKDGIPDAIERLIGTDPANPDSDKDGVPDGLDASPMTPKNPKSDDQTEIRQAVFTVLFATSSSSDAIFLREEKGKSDFAEQEYYGFAGYVVKTPSSRPGLVNVTDMTVKLDSADSATATISDWEGSLAASGHEAKLKKVHGKWVVVDFRMTWIS